MGNFRNAQSEFFYQEHTIYRAEKKHNSQASHWTTFMLYSLLRDSLPRKRRGGSTVAREGKCRCQNHRVDVGDHCLQVTILPIPAIVKRCWASPVHGWVTPVVPYIAFWAHAVLLIILFLVCLFVCLLVCFLLGMSVALEQRKRKLSN